jgi:hypothetical protein
MGNIQCSPSKHESDDQKYTGVIGNSKGDNFTLTVNGTYQDAKDQHGKKYRDFEINRGTDAQHDGSQNQKVLVFSLLFQPVGPQ